MVEVYTLSTRAYSYKELAKKIIKHGRESKTTRFLRHASVSIDMSALSEEIVALPKTRINGAASSIKYALAETIWYVSKQRKTDLIAKFGPIWKKMEDSKGLVNSNYGYQIFNNQNIEEKIAELVKNKKVRFLIASDENQFSRTDLVCNNAVDLYLNEENEINVRVVARSIDLVYGYPYDVFAAQLFIRYIQKKLKESHDLDTVMKRLRFDIEDVHIYNKDYDFATSVIEDVKDDEFILIHANEIFETLSDIEFNNITSKNVAAIREHLAEKSFEKEIPEINSQIEDRVKTEIYRDSYAPHLKQVVLKEYTKDKSTSERFDQVIQFLNKDKFDRKNLVKADDSLIYISRITCGFGTSKYEVVKYEL